MEIDNRALMILIAILAVLGLIMSMAAIGSIREVQEKQDSMGVVITDIARTVRAPDCVDRDYNRAIMRLRLMGQSTDHDTVLNEMVRMYGSVYDSGDLREPHWLTDLRAPARR